MSGDRSDRQERLHRGVLAGAVVVGCGVPYVATFALLVAEDVFIGSHWYTSVPGGEKALEAVFRPLIWLINQF